MTTLAAASPPGEAVDPPTARTWVQSAEGLLCKIPALGLSASDRQTVTIRARMLVDSASRGPGSSGDAARHARRLRAVLRATGNPAAGVLAAGIAEDPPEAAAWDPPERTGDPGG